MASIFTNTNVNAFNRRQITVAAKNIGVITPTSNHNTSTTIASIVTAVKAK